MAELFYLDHYRLQEPDLPPFTLCGGLRAPYVVDPSVPPATRPVIWRWKKSKDKEPSLDACYLYYLRGYFGLQIKPSAMGQKVSADWATNTSNWD